MNDQDYEELRSEFEAFKHQYGIQIDSLQERIRELEEKFESGELTLKDGLEEFVAGINPENHQQCAVAIGYYYDKKQGEKFTLKNLEEGFEKSRWKKYSNMSMLKSKLVDEKEWLMESGEDDEGNVLYKLTKEGIKFVEDRME